MGGKREGGRLLGKAACGESDNWDALHVYVTAGGGVENGLIHPCCSSMYKSHNPSWRATLSNNQHVACRQIEVVNHSLSLGTEAARVSRNTVTPYIV